MTEKKETVGKVSVDLAAQEAPTRDPIELERAIHKDYEDNIYLCIDRHKKDFIGDFYIVVLTKRERLLQNVLRHYFFGRATCPTPEYDQAVYKFHRNGEVIEFLWVIPSKETCEHFRLHALEVHDLERDLLKFVLDFYDDTLMKKAKMLNGEALDTPLLVAP